MNERQYSRLRQNRCYTRLARLSDPHPQYAGSRSPVASILARAAGQLQHRAQAQAAWQRIAHPQWLAATTLDTIESRTSGGCTVVIAADNSTILYDLQRHRTTLQQQLSKLVPGVRHLRVIVSTPHHASDAQGHGTE